MSPCQLCGRRLLTLLFAWCALVWRIRPIGDGWAGVNAGRWLAFPLEWGMARVAGCGSVEMLEGVIRRSFV